MCAPYPPVYPIEDDVSVSIPSTKKISKKLYPYDLLEPKIKKTPDFWGKNMEEAYSRRGK